MLIFSTFLFITLNINPSLHSKAHKVIYFQWQRKHKEIVRQDCSMYSNNLCLFVHQLRERKHCKQDSLGAIFSFAQECQSPLSFLLPQVFFPLCMQVMLILDIIYHCSSPSYTHFLHYGVTDMCCTV